MKIVGPLAPLLEEDDELEDELDDELELLDELEDDEDELLEEELDELLDEPPVTPSSYQAKLKTWMLLVHCWKDC